MRYIDLDRLLGDPGAALLIVAAENARQAILAETDSAKRHAYIEKYRKHWVAFRAEFERVFGAKCWYVECENPGTDDDIDHFRPKSSLAEDPSHSGYWWEAFNWKNFRLSCHRANRLRANPSTGETGGKGDHFPLIDESKRCREPADDLMREEPVLLDPTDPADPPLLTFNIDGTVDLAPEYAGAARARRRVDESRIHLHLDWPRFTEGRQALYRSVYTKVVDGDGAARRWDAGDPTAREGLRIAARDLIRMAANNAPYSRAARAYIRIFRDRSWVNQLVIPNIESAA